MIADPNHQTEFYILNITYGIMFRPRILIYKYDGLQQSIISKIKFDYNNNIPILNPFHYFVKMVSTMIPRTPMTMLMYISVV